MTPSRPDVDVLPRAWHGVFQGWFDALTILGQPIAPPQFMVPLTNDAGYVSWIWSRGFFQDVHDKLLILGASVAPAIGSTPLEFNGYLSWAWIGWMQSVHDAFTALGQVVSPPPIRTAITEKEKNV